MLGQIGGGNPAQVYRSWAGNANNPVAPTQQESEGIALQKLRQPLEQRAIDQQAMQQTADRDFQGGQAEANRQNALAQTMAPINFKRDVFNQVSPLLSGLMTGDTQRVGGQSSAAPGITRGPVWTDQQIQEQVNAGQAANQASADTQNRGTAARMAGQGFGSRSPLLAALQGGTNMQTAAANADLARTTRWDAAQGNADQTYRTDQLGQQAWNLAEQQDIARRQMQQSYTTNLASVLAGLV